MLRVHNSAVVAFVSLACSAVGFLAVCNSGYSQDDRANDVAAGRQLFTHKWKAHDPLSPMGDGLGPAFNEVSCIACHFQGGIGGAGINDKNVDLLCVGTLIAPTEPLRKRIREKVDEVHPLLGTNSVAMLHRFNTNENYEAWRTQRLQMKPPVSTDPTVPSRPPRRMSDSIRFTDIPVQFVQRNTPALFGAALIDTIPDDVIREEAAFQNSNNVGVTGRVPRASSPPSGNSNSNSPSATPIGRFGWRGQTSSLREFVLGACSNELGLEIPDNPQADDPLQVAYKAPGYDLSIKQCDQLVAFVASLPRPQQILPESKEGVAEVRQGERIFNQVLCANCHVKQLGDVDGLYSDLLLHEMGAGLADPIPPNSESDQRVTTQPNSELDRSVSTSTDRRTPRMYYGGLSDMFAQVSPTLQQEWRTPPLWGVRDSAPYMHDGRAKTLEEAIALHGGEATQSIRSYNALPKANRKQLILFLKSLAAPIGVN